MARVHSEGHYLGKLFKVASIAVVSVLALVIFVSATQKPTNTQSHASTCNSKPNFSYTGAVGSASNIVYKFEVRNVNYCYGILQYYLIIQNAPSKSWSFRDSITYYDDTSPTSITRSFMESPNLNGYTLKRFYYTPPAGVNSPGHADSDSVNDVHWFKLKVTPPSGASNGKYKFSVKLCKASGDLLNGYKLTSNCTTPVSLPYIKD